MATFLKSIFVCLFVAAALHATTIRVPADESTIQAAIDAASNGDTVVVYPGTYYENIIFRGKKIVVTSRFFETGDLSFVKSTIINGSQPIYPDTSSCVLIINGEDSTTVLQGFTITGGEGTKWVDEHGAGTYREGGGILVAKSAPVIRFNLITVNEAINTSGVTSAGGGGIRAGDGNVKILNNVVMSNKGRYGAGIALNYTGAVVRNNILTDNSGGQDYGGGALWMNHDGSVGKLIENNTIVDNKVVGVYVYQGSSIIRNCILWGNASSEIGARSGGPTVSYSDVQGGQTGTGNINLDPMVTDTSFRLQSGSPCIDAGDTSGICNDIEDATSAGNAFLPSHGSLRNDMGAYGGPGADELPVMGSTTGIVPRNNSKPTGFRLEQNYPNPFNPTTVIGYRLSPKGQAAICHVTLKVYDILGKELQTLVDEHQFAGNHSVNFSSQGLASGVYLYRLEAGGYTATRKLTVLK
jgi:hypothetical protein